MLRPRIHFKLIPILLVLAIFCSACEVPDISEFTKQSAEMTRGIRTGVKDTDSLIKAASERRDLYSDATRARLKTDLKAYKSGIKPTVETLDALDAYLEALNALAQANKKSEENSKAAVNAVAGLVTAVSGLTFASSAVNVATGLVTLAEQFRTAKAFKKRVNLAAEIVEGRYDDKRDAAGNLVLDQKGKPIPVKACSGNAEDTVTEASGKIKDLVTAAMKRALAPERTPPLTDAQKKELEKPQWPVERREQLRSLGIITDAEFGQIQAAESIISRAGCGVIDLLKFNVKDLKEINQAVSNSMYDNIKDKTGPVIRQHDENRIRRDDIRKEITGTLAVKNLVSRINELVINDVDPNLIVRRKMRLKENLDNLFAQDSPLRKEMIESITECGQNCGRMLDVLNLIIPPGCDNPDCMDELKRMLSDANLNRTQFDRSTGIIIGVLDARKEELVSEDQKLAEDLVRLKPDYDAVIAELKTVGDKRDQLDSLLTTSVSALKAWADAHANLRVAVNTKKPLTVSKLTSEVREIWGIIDQGTK
jgi:prefoldin subunit 5